MVDINCNQMMSSYAGLTCEVMPTLSLTRGYNSDAAYSFNHLNNEITEYNPTMADNRDQFSFLKGLLENGNKPGDASMYTDSHMRQISYDMLHSPERISSITAFSEKCSTITTSSDGDCLSEFGAFDRGPFLSNREYNSESSSKDSLQQHQFSQCVANTQNLPTMAFSSKLTETSEFANSALQISACLPLMIGEDTNFPGKDFLPKSHFFEQKQQQPYSSYEQFNKPLEDEASCLYAGLSECCSSVAGQVDPVHSQVPSEQLNRVYVASESSSHLSSSKCNTSKCRQDFENFYNFVVRDSSSSLSGQPGSCSSENMLPPAKRLKRSSHCSEKLPPSSKDPKMEKSCCPLSSENRIASVLPSLVVQPSNPDGLPSLQQLPESPISINSEVLEGKIDLLTKPMQNPLSLIQPMNNAGDFFSRLNAESFAPSKELIIHPMSKEIDSKNFGELAKSSEFGFNAIDKLSEELGTTSKEELSLVRSNFDFAKPDIEVEKENELKPGSPEIRGLSLIECFSADEIKDHISSLHEWISQRTSKEEKEKQIRFSANENTCQLCAADKLLLAPVPIYCSSCGSRIKRSVIYYSTSEENGMRHCFCTPCYKARGGSIIFYGITIPKVKLDKKKNDEEIEEPWVQCDKCKHWQHQICALFNDKRDMEGKSEYLCPRCCLEEIRGRKHVPLLPKASVFFAKDLPRSLLSDYIEQRLFRHLNQEKEERATFIGENLNEVPGAENLVVRVVLSVNKQLKVKQQFLGIFHNGNYPDGFPYRSKVILLFQRIEGVDVCLFGMYVQEFGSECSQPNHRCVYISYLDSVKYFRPERETAAGEALRTFVYHEILIAYLEYCKKRGFVACYLWACPPLKGEDYILYCHPEIQKTPRSDKLRQWYHSMLRKAAKENIVVNFTNLYEHFFVSTGKFYSKVTAARLPYFDGDYWSSAAETAIRNIEKQNGEYSGRKVKKVMTKRTLKAMGHSNSSDGATKDILLMQELGKTISSVKEDFIVVHLQSVCSYCREVILSGWRWCCSHCKNFQLCQRCHDAEQDTCGVETHTVGSKEKHLLSKAVVDDVQSDTNDEDVILDNWLFENRHIFLGFCQRNHYQFDTLRRAKHSSMMILHHLHNPRSPAAGTTCNTCQQDTNTNDRNVCTTCYSKKLCSSRIHKLAYYSSVPDVETESRYAKEKKLKQMELLNVLQHSSQCGATGANPCSYPNCHKMKRLFLHASKCTIRICGGCMHCQKVWYALRLHARNCGQINCRIPRCRDLKDRYSNNSLLYLRPGGRPPLQAPAFSQGN